MKGLLALKHMHSPDDFPRIANCAMQHPIVQCSNLCYKGAAYQGRLAQRQQVDGEPDAAFPRGKP